MIKNTGWQHEGNINRETESTGRDKRRRKDVKKERIEERLGDGNWQIIEQSKYNKSNDRVRSHPLYGLDSFLNFQFPPRHFPKPIGTVPSAQTTAFSILW